MRVMTYLIAIVASYAAVQAWRRAAGTSSAAILGNAPCSNCVENPQEAKGCCGGH
jgi:hypothetical protein